MKLGKLPSEVFTSRQWRTCRDPFGDDRPTIVKVLEEALGLEAKTLFPTSAEATVVRNYLPRDAGDRYADGQQRQVQRWRATSGPDKELFFPQQHVPGEAAQLDFTRATSR